MDFWKMSKRRRAILAILLSLMLALSGMSPQALAEALGEITRDSKVVEEVLPQTPAATQSTSASDDKDLSGATTIEPNGSSSVTAPQKEPKSWTIALDANGGVPIEGSTSDVARLESLEDGDPVQVPNVYVRDGYELAGWSTVADPVAWKKAREEALVADPDLSEPDDTPLFVPAGASLYNLVYAYVTLDDGTIRQVSDVVVARGCDDEGRAVQTCDLRPRAKNGTLTLYAQWKRVDQNKEVTTSGKPVTSNEEPAKDADEGTVPSSASVEGPASASLANNVKTGNRDDAGVMGKTSNADPASDSNPAGYADLVSGADLANGDDPAGDADPAGNTDQTGGTDPIGNTDQTGNADAGVTLPQSAEPAADPPAGNAALLTDPEFVRDSAKGDKEASALLDQAEQRTRMRGLFARSASGLRSLSASNVTDARSPQYLDGTTIEDFSLMWNTPDTPGSEDGDLANLNLTPADDAALNMQARLQFALSGEKNYAAGTIQITIPAQAIRDRDGNLIGSMTLGVPEEPDATQSFAYRLVTPESGEPYYVITNTRTLDSATTGVIQFSIRGITPHVVHSGAVSQDLQAEMTLVTARGHQMAVGTSPLTATINTSEHIANAYKNGGKVIDVSSPLVPDKIRNALENLSDATTVGDYVLVRWNTYANVEGNQSFNFVMRDTLGSVLRDGEAIDAPGSAVLGATESASNAPGTSYEKLVLDRSYLMSGESRYENVWTAYPKSLFEDNHEYEIHNDVTWTVTPLDAPQTATSKSATAKISYHTPTPVAFTANPGHYNIEKETLEPHRYSTSTNTALTELHGVGTGANAVPPKDTTIWFDVTAYGEIMEQTMADGMSLEDVLADAQNPIADPASDSRFHQRYVTMEATDDAIYLAGDYASELGSGDYYISGVRLYDPYVYTYGHEDGDETKPWDYVRNRMAAPLPSVELWGLSEATGGTAQTWTKYATMTYSDVNARTVATSNGASNEGAEIILPESLGVTRVKMVSSVKDYDALRLQFKPSVTLRCEGPRVSALVDQLFAESDNPFTFLRNDVTLAVYHGDAIDGTGADVPDVDPSDAQLDAADAAKVFAISASSQSVDYARTHAMDQARYGKDMWHYSSMAYLRGAMPRVGVTSRKTLKYDPQTDLDSGAMRATLHYTATVHEQSNILTREAYDQYVADGAIEAETSGTWYDLLPPGVTPDLSSITLRDADSVEDAYTIGNYRGTGRTLLVVKASLVPRPKYNDVVGDASAGEGQWAQGYYDEPRISFDAIYSYADYSAVEITDQNQVDELVNVIAFQSGNDALGNQEGMEGEYDDATGGTTTPKTYRNKETEAAVEPAPDVPNMAELMSDLDSATSTKKPTFVYARAESRITVDRSSVSSITKQVASDAEGIYRSGTSEQSGWAAHANQVNVYEGHGYTYRIEVARGNGETSNIVLYDALENYQVNESNTDYPIGEHRWKGTLTGVDTSQIQAAGVAPVVWYSTTIDGFDSRGAVGNNTNVGTVDSEYIINTLDDQNADWVRADQYSGDLSAVTAVAIDCSKASDNSDFVLPQGSALIAYIHMRAPTEVKTGNTSNLFNKIAPADDEDEPNNNAHAFNNVYINSSVRGSSDANARTEFYHPDYVKVGILPYKIAVNKVWDDANNNDGKRPDTVTVHLLANGQPAKDENGTVVPEVVLGSAKAGQAGYGSDGWSYTIEDIPYLDAQNNVIRYTLREDAIAEELDDHTAVNLYVPSYLRTDDAHLQITNKRVPETVDLVVNKAWEDDDDAYGKRPSTIELLLYADGAYKETKTAHEATDGTWSYTFTDLPAYKGGKRIVYTVEEKPVDYYAADMKASDVGSGSTVGEDGTIQGSVNIINTYSDTGLLGISKTCEGVVSEAGRNAEFLFKVELFGTELDEGNKPLPLGDTFAYYVLDMATNQKVAGSEGTLRTGDTVAIKAGQRAIVEGIPIGSTYKVTEQSTPGFYQSASANTTGTIGAGVNPNHAADVSFTNTYSSAGSFQLKATKRLEGQRLGLYAFRFQAYQVFNEGVSDNEDPTKNEYEQVVRSVSNGAGGDVDESGTSAGDVVFGRVNVTDKDLGPDGTLTLLYRIREVNVGKAGYTYATNAEQVRVTLRDNGDGTITATQTPEVASGTSHIKPLGDDAPITDEPFSSNGDATFTNAYDASGTLELMAWKALKGGTLAEGRFTFRLTALTTGAPVADAMTATNDASGVVNFPTIQLTGVHGGKSYIYKVSEVEGNAEDVNYSDEVYYYRVDVTDDGAGNLTTTNTVVKPKADATGEAVDAGDPNAFETSGAQPIITNTLKPGNLQITKLLNTEDAEHANQEFTFRVRLTGPDLADSYTYSVDSTTSLTVQGLGAAQRAEGSEAQLRDGVLEVTIKPGQKATIEGIPAGTTYQVFEDTVAGWQLVSQSGTSGAIEPLGTSSAVFTNQYAPGEARAQLYATKTLDGASAANGAFDFVLTGLNGAPMPQGATDNTLEVKNGDAGLVSFPTITFDGAGTYTYAITEKPGDDDTINYDLAEWTATVTVTNTGTASDPVLSASVSYSNGVDEQSSTPPAFANTTKPGELTVAKLGQNVTPANKDAEFDFTVQLQNSGQPVNDVSYYIANADGTPVTAQSTDAAHAPSVVGRIASGAANNLVHLIGPRVAYAAENDSGTFGVDGSCTWEWDDATGTFTIKATSPGTDAIWAESVVGVAPPISNYKSLLKRFVVDSSNGTIYVHNTTSFSRLFQGFSLLEYANLEGLDVRDYMRSASTGALLTYMFDSCGSLVEVYLPEFSTPDPTSSDVPVNTGYMFNKCTSLTTVSIPKMTLSQRGGVSGSEQFHMFNECTSLVSIDLSGIWVEKYQNQGLVMSHMFNGCSSLQSVVMGIHGAENIESMSYMFRYCRSLVDIDLSKLDYSAGSTPMLEDTTYMFRECTQLKSINFNGFDASALEKMSYMFRSCTALTDLDLTDLNATSIKEINAAFWGCTNLQSLDISSFDFSHVTTASSMLREDAKLSKIVIGTGFKDLTGDFNHYPDAPPTTGGYTGKWVMVEDPTQVKTYQQLMASDGTTDAGTWVWQVDPTYQYVVNFKTNGAYYDVNNNAIPGSVTKSANESITLPTPKWDIEDQVFVGWYREPDFSGTKFDGGGTYTKDDLLGDSTSAYVTLYAEWADNSTPTGTINVWQQNTNLDTDHSTYALAKSNEYEFTAPVGSTETITPEDIDGFITPSEQNVTVAQGATIDFYYDCVSYTIVFEKNAEDAMGTMESMAMVGGVAKKLNPNAFTREDYTFLGWNTAASGTGASYADQAQVKNLAQNGQTIKLYAQWIPGGSDGSSSTGTYTFKLKAGQTVHFANVPAGTTYTVVESNAPNGWTQTASSDTSGTVPAAGVAQASITNTYDATGVVSLQAKKTMASGSLADGQFSFQLLDEFDQVLQTVTNLAPEEGTATASILFDQLDFSLADLVEDGTYVGPKTFTYKICEVVDGQDGVIYDTGGDREVTVTVADAGTGRLTVTPSNVSTTGTGSEATTIVSTEFVNDYEPGALEVNKTSTGTNEASESTTFTFTVKLVDAQGNSVGNRSYDLVRIGADGAKSTIQGGAAFIDGVAAIAGIGDGESFRIEGIAKDTNYEVSEFGIPDGFTQSAVSGDKGVIGAGATSRASFTNAYAADGSISLVAKKTLEGGTISDYTFTFQLFDDANNLLQTKTNDTAGNVSFEALAFSAMDAGTKEAPKTYSYKIAEVNDGQANVVYDGHSGWLDVKVWDEGSGELTAQAVYDHALGSPSATPETFANKLLRPVEMPATGGPGWAIPIAAAVIVASAEAARRMRRRQRND